MPTQPEPLGALSGARVVASPPVTEVPVNSVATKTPEVQPVEPTPLLEAVAPGWCCPLLPFDAWLLPIGDCCPLLPARTPEEPFPI